MAIASQRGVESSGMVIPAQADGGRVWQARAGPDYTPPCHGARI